MGYNLITLRAIAGFAISAAVVVLLCAAIIASRTPRPVAPVLPYVFSWPSISIAPPATARGGPVYVSADPIQTAINALGRKKLRPSDVIWECTPLMKLGSLYAVRLRVETKPLADFKNDLDEAISRMGQRVLLSVTPEAALESEVDAFNIVRRTSAKTIVQEGAYTEWIWDVRPKRTGIYRMNIRIVSAVQLNGVDLPFDAFRDAKPVAVGFDLRYFLSSATESEAPKWFSALVVGLWMLVWLLFSRLGKWIWGKLFKRRGPSTPAPDE